jgi:hypothetical protein
MLIPQKYHYLNTRIQFSELLVVRALEPLKRLVLVLVLIHHGLHRNLSTALILQAIPRTRSRDPALDCSLVC